METVTVSISTMYFIFPEFPAESGELEFSQAFLGEI